MLNAESSRFSAYGLENYSEEQLFEAAKLANAFDFIQGFEDGFDTRIGERGVRLSGTAVWGACEWLIEPFVGGQKQRIAIARAMLRRAPLLFLVRLAAVQIPS